MNNTQRPENQIGGTEFSLPIHKTNVCLTDVGNPRPKVCIMEVCPSDLVETNSSSATGVCAVRTPHIGLDPVAHWIVEIKASWARDAASTLDLARVISAAKTQLSRHYGQWSRLWAAARKMPVSKSTADRLAEIGQRMGWVDSATSLNLPRGWNILHCLARVDRRTLEHLIQQGDVHPQLTLREAKELVTGLRGKRTRAKTPKATIRQWLWRSGEFIRANQKNWQPEDRDLATEGLAGLIREIGAARPTGSEQTADCFAWSGGPNDVGAAPRIFISPRRQTI